jgi:hypothetical protein
VEPQSGIALKSLDDLIQAAMARLARSPQGSGLDHISIPQNRE